MLVEERLRKRKLVSHINSLERAIRKIGIEMSIQGFHDVIGAGPRAFPLRLTLALPDARPFALVFASKSATSTLERCSSILMLGLAVRAS